MTTFQVNWGTTGHYENHRTNSEAEALTMGRALAAMGEDVTVNMGLYPAVYETVNGQLVEREDIEDELATTNVR